MVLITVRGTMYMDSVLRDGNLKKVSTNVRVDNKRRVYLPKDIVKESNVIYEIYVNKSGQILLDPQVPIPASELWLFRNKDILAAIDKGMEESMTGKVKKRDSFSRYLNDEA